MENKIKNFFSENEINSLARQTKFVQRDSSKLQGEEFLKTLMLTDFNAEEMSLEDMSCIFKTLYNIEICSQSINERFNQFSVAFFKALIEKFLEEIINQSSESSDIFKTYTRVLIKDSTSFQLPENLVKYFKGSGGSASASQIRIQFEFDFKTGKITDLSLHSFNDQDQTDAKLTKENIEKGELLLRDLGYISLRILKFIIKIGAYYLNRLPTNMNVFTKNSIEEFELLNYCEIVKSMIKKGLNTLEKEVYLGSEKEVKTRFIMVLFPADIHAGRIQEAKNKRNRLNKKKRKENKKIEKENKILIKQGKELKKLKEIKGALTKQEKAKLALGFYITNTEKKDIPAEKVRTVYRLRWQIELVFKAWKQNCEIDKTKKMKVERFITHLYAKLLLVLTNWFIFWEMSKNAWKDKQIVLSVQKTFKRLKAIKETFTVAIRKTSSKLITEFIQSIFELQDKCQLENKKGQLTLKEIMFMFK